MATDELVNFIQQVHSGKIKIDHSPKSIRSNVTTNALLHRLTSIVSHNAHTKVFDWQVLNWLIQKAIDGMEKGKVINPDICTLVTELEETKRQLAKYKEYDAKNSQTITVLHKQVMDLKKELGR